jgi:zinc D-Ala-D-Ala dipeptidase
MTLLLSDRRVAAARAALPSGIYLRVVEGRCYLAADGISREARANRDLLAGVLCREGLVNYPSEWWHYSYGDRCWAVATGAGAALYGPVLR